MWILSHGEKGVFSQTTVKCKESETRVQDPTGFSARPWNSSVALSVSSHVSALPVAWLSDFLDSNPPFYLSWLEWSFCCLQTKDYVCTCVKKKKWGGSSPHIWPIGARTNCSVWFLVKGRGKCVTTEPHSCCQFCQSSWWGWSWFWQCKDGLWEQAGAYWVTLRQPCTSTARTWL